MIRIAIAFLALALIAGYVRSGEDALDEVNAARGLPPYQRDMALTAGASQAADFRAANRIEGHTFNDFAALPPGCSADAAGCAAWEPSWGFGACAMFENWRYAGAASTMGADGKRYCHLFVSQTPSMNGHRVADVARHTASGVVQTVNHIAHPRRWRR